MKRLHLVLLWLLIYFCDIGNPI